MKASLRPGVSRTNRIVVEPARTISFMGEEGRVYATTWFVRDIEHTCRDLILEHTDPGEDSVGIEVGIKQSAATPPGMTVEITVTTVEGRGRADRRRHACALRRRCRQDPGTGEREGRQAPCPVREPMPCR
jgi:predicted thioesterase